MDLLGKWQWVANGEAAPYPLCPFLGECLRYKTNTTL